VLELAYYLRMCDKTARQERPWCGVSSSTRAMGTVDKARLLACTSSTARRQQPDVQRTPAHHPSSSPSSDRNVFLLALLGFLERLLSVSH
jgi:hypothetical protein